MNNEVFIKYYDSSYVQVDADFDWKVYEMISDSFSFFADGYRFQPKYKAGVWDGKIKLFDRQKNLLPFGLLSKLLKLLSTADYDIQLDPVLRGMLVSDITYEQIEEFCSSVLKLPFEPHDYQIMAVLEALKTGRRIIKSPTASGKSLIQYIIIRYLLDVENFKRVLVTVPTVNLVTQLKGDFEDYAQNDEDYYSDKVILLSDKFSKKDWDNSKIVISTWQSLQRKDERFFNDNFDVLMSDECHTMAGVATSGIVKRSSGVPVKLGFTGTVSNSFTGELSLIGLFGPIYSTITTDELIKRGATSNLAIKAIRIKYTGVASGLSYQDEMNFLRNNSSRNEFICKIGTKLTGNTLILFQNHDQADMLESILKTMTDRPILRVDGKVDKVDRELARKQAEAADLDNGVIILASYPTFQAGVNIKNLHNIIMAAPTKSMIRLFQSIGRVLRKHHTKDTALVIDIFDDFQYNGKSKNHTMRHFLERYQLYKSAKMEVNIADGITISI